MPLLSGVDPTYPPLDVPKAVAESVWIVDSGPLRLLGMPLPVRMTVFRLAGGGLLLHSPTRYDENLRRELERLGPIRHFVAPNIAHWSFLADWQRACPAALTWAAPNLREREQVKKAGIRLDRDLPAESPSEWGDEIEQAVVPGRGGFTEVAFFHEPSRTLVLTDLVVNLEPHKLPLVPRQIFRLAGALAPHGRAPIYLRMIVAAKRPEASRAAARLMAWAPERVIFSHGRWFERDATAALRRSLVWLLPPL